MVNLLSCVILTNPATYLLSPQELNAHVSELLQNRDTATDLLSMAKSELTSNYQIAPFHTDGILTTFFSAGLIFPWGHSH